ncbi:transglutaminase domain-containing protein [Roseibacillus persicicus]|uniref:transglutaminase domain-containing protein n=1 Tax=Roseibacillus persicicus TaxID=454148 RepID=UPI002811CEAA|nr:transglutaminase domain-containing protein [Roseibacillus persicicus]
MRNMFTKLGILLLLFPLAVQAETELAKLRGMARSELGEEGARAADFLISYMPVDDQEKLSADLLYSNLSHAMKARGGFPWARELSQELFFNDVVPYAVLDETREDWRPRFYEICSSLVKDCKTASEAAQVLNRDLFNKVNVHYNTGRKKPNQSPSESMASGKATCTGLSIILAYGCRSVGIPARVAGTALWSDKSGNHTWVEIWDGEWKFLGADEYDAKGLNRGWFINRASQARADEWQHAIWASSWKTADAHFPMVWNPKDKTVFAVNVTERYAQEAPADKALELGVRVFQEKDGPRVEAEVAQLDEAGNVISSTFSKAGRADLNDVAVLSLKGKAPWKLRVLSGQERKEILLEKVPEQALDIILKHPEAAAAKIDLTDVIAAWKEEGREEREEELAKKVIQAAGKEMKFLERKFGEAPAEGHALWISMHGGGGAPARVNDGQWQNQIKLYQPKEGYYVAPRAPSDTWNLWHQDHIDALFDRLIANYVICRGVDPNRVYLMGYSAGGDGVYQLAPRMADRFAAAAMMAGHPNETKPDGLRNLPFEIFMGGEDGAYKRNQIAANWKELLAEKQKADPNGYPHRVTIYPGLGHWMERKDAEVLPRMAEKRRAEWPKKVVWLQDDVTHERFYWLGVKFQGAVKGRKLIGEVDGQTIRVTGEDVSGLKFWLSDELLDLDQEVVIELNGKEAFRGIVKRQPAVAAMSLRLRCGMIATGLVVLD